MHKVHINKSLIDSAVKNLIHDTPYLLLDLATAVENCKTFKKLLPNIHLLYAVKAFYSKELLEALSPWVDGFDVASLQELKDVLAHSETNRFIAFSNPVKSRQVIRAAHRMGIQSFTCQSKEEIQKIVTEAPMSEVIVRVRVNDSHSLVPLSDKFGCEPEDAVELLEYSHALGLVAKGVTFHIGSQLLDGVMWESAINLMHDIVYEARARGLNSVDTINIGGGFPARYFEEDAAIEVAAKHIRKVTTDNSIVYMAEPGRYIIANAGVTVSRIIGREKRHAKPWLFIDTGLFQSFLGSVRYERFPYIPLVVGAATGKMISSSKTISYVITGPSCDSQDVINESVELPASLKEGDYLLFPNTGAYTLVYGSRFNGFAPPKIKYTHKK